MPDRLEHFALTSGHSPRRWHTARMELRPHRILVVDDEPPIVELRHRLPRRARAGSSRAPATASRPSRPPLRFDPDVIVLDVMLPGLDGIEVCRRLRTFSDAYVLMLTARGEEIDRIMGLTVGADDYLVKPFSPREVVARIKALLRRPRPGRRCRHRPSAGESPAPRAARRRAWRSTRDGVWSGWTGRRSTSRPSSSTCSPCSPGSRASWSCAPGAPGRAVGPGVRGRRPPRRRPHRQPPPQAGRRAGEPALRRDGPRRRLPGARGVLMPRSLRARLLIAFLVVDRGSHRHRGDRRDAGRPRLLHRRDGPPARRPDGRGDGRVHAGRLHRRDAPGPDRGHGDRGDHRHGREPGGRGPDRPADRHARARRTTHRSRAVRGARARGRARRAGRAGDLVQRHGRVAGGHGAPAPPAGGRRGARAADPADDAGRLPRGAGGRRGRRRRRRPGISCAPRRPA